MNRNKKEEPRFLLFKCSVFHDDIQQIHDFDLLAAERNRNVIVQVQTVIGLKASPAAQPVFQTERTGMFFMSEILNEVFKEF